MNELLEALSDTVKKKLIKKKMPDFEEPMLATLTKDYFDNKNWL
jgi:bifunctional non-homologous end joining protein LigD